MYRLPIVAIIIVIICYRADGRVPVGAWRDHLSYSRSTHVAVGDGKVYAASGTGIIVYNKSGNSIEKLSKVHGLSDIDISSMEWCDENRLLLVGYSNGNLDILKDNRITNLSDILRSPVSGSKRINSIMFSGQLAYLSCNFGIVVINLERNEVMDTYFLGDGGIRLIVYGMASDGASLYAATSAGLYMADINAPNLADFSYWTRLDFLPEPGALFSSVAWFDNRLFALQMTASGNYVSYRIDGESWEYFPESPGNVLRFRVTSGNLVMVFESRADFYGPGGLFNKSIDSYGFWGIAIRDVRIDDENSIWIADMNFGLIRKRGESYEVFTPQGPFSNRVFSVSSYPERTYFAAGGYTQTFANLWLNGEFSVLREGTWTGIVNYDIRDVLYVAEHPADPDIQMVATWGYGLVEYRGGMFHQRYSEENSSLRSIIPGSHYVRIAGMAFDSNNNLWLTNPGVPNPVSVRRANGEWASFPFGGIINHAHIGRLIVSRYGHKWVLLPRGGGLFVFDESGASGNMLARRFSITDQDNSLISNEVHSIAEDMNGYIWVGTNKGVVVYYYPSAVFSDDTFFARRIVISGIREDDLGYLLDNETVTAIAVDGADRKWLGTDKSGVFLVSADGKRQIHHFTRQNSPLLSNAISDISIDPATGEVFFATSAGVVSYRGEATAPDDVFRNVYVFPNPVRENYDGPVTITGLVKDTVVKITDISGNLVYETVSLGGQAIWDGRNLRGRRVQTGIYLVFLSSRDGNETHVTKLMFIH